LQFEIGTEFWAFFLKDNVEDIPNQIKLKIVGIYDSGFQDFDANYVFVDLRHIQRMNGWTSQQVGAFEVFIDDFGKIQEKGRAIYGVTLSTLDSQTIADKYFTIFE